MEIGLQSRYIVALLRLDLEKTVHPLKACPLTSRCVCVYVFVFPCGVQCPLQADCCASGLNCTWR